MGLALVRCLAGVAPNMFQLGPAGLGMEENGLKFALDWPQTLARIVFILLLLRSVLLKERIRKAIERNFVVAGSVLCSVRGDWRCVQFLARF